MSAPHLRPLKSSKSGASSRKAGSGRRARGAKASEPTAAATHERERTPSLWQIRRTCSRTVKWLIPSDRPMSLLLSPAAIRQAISTSRRVSTSLSAPGAARGAAGEVLSTT